MTTPTADTEANHLADLLRQLVPRGALWWRPLGCRKYRLLETFPTVADAVGALFERQPRLVGDFLAIAAGKNPADLDEDDDRPAGRPRAACGR